jgi:hypothetical protein
MKTHIKTIILLLIASTALTAYGQDKIYIEKICGGSIWRPMKVTKIDSFAQLPARIKIIVNEVFKKSLTDFSDNIFFSQGQMLNIEDYAATDSSFQSLYQYPLPKYFLEFNLQDTSISIKSYCLQLSLDQYGQVLSFNWPRKHFNKRQDFVLGSVLKNEAVQFAKGKNYKTGQSFFEMHYNEERRRVEWHFYFLQKQLTNKRDDYEKEYDIIAIDAISKELSEKGKMWQSGHHINSLGY